MPIAAVGDVDIFFETFGDEADPVMILISGLGGQLLEWDAALCRELAARGFQVVRFDNRDVGLSSRVDKPVDLDGLLAGEPVEVPYRLTDMATDVVGLLDHVAGETAACHLVGVSVGGMIAQTVAIEHPERVLTLTSMMTTTGEPDVGLPTAEALDQFLAPPATTREEALERAVARGKVWASQAYFDEGRRRRMAGEAWDRDHDPDGPARHAAAVLASGNRAEALASLSVATLVIHGTEDKLVQPSGGMRTAELIPGARLLMVDGMGHDTPPQLWPQLIDAITSHAIANTPTR
jgi:pimeloyl-ACP methyl ester carboxylesterase